MPTEVNCSALVLFSGGQDSTTCLTWALTHYAHVETIGFNYGQRHAVELKQRPTIRAKLARLNPHWRERLGEDHVIDLSVLGKMSDTAMTRDVEITTSEKGLPSTFVPGRNIMFLTFAAALAYRRALKCMVGGMCETDFSGYPDCRDDAIKALQVALNLGMESRFVIDTPLMWLNKAATWALAHELGGEALVGLIIEDTHTCYLGERGERHEWGYGCGLCPACELRARGWREWRSAAPSTQPQTSTSN
jgi:7-cyano-7-deazaguanine synthase